MKTKNEKIFLHKPKLEGFSIHPYNTYNHNYSILEKTFYFYTKFYL